MFCPKCRAEYREGIAVCSDCGVELVAELPPKVREASIEFVEVLRTFNPGDIAMVSSLLEGAEIDYYINNENFNSIRPLVEPARVLVSTRQLDEARELLRDLELSFRGINPPDTSAGKKEEPTTVEPEIAIRAETDADVDAIREVTIAAFKTLEISNQTEHFIIEALRAAGALTVSLVAEIEGRVVGHIAFSPVTVSDGSANWYGLGPVSVLPEYQRRGIGTALIQEGLSRLRDLDAGGCCLVGHPDYYRRLGFENVSGLVHEGVPQEVFLALSLDGRVPQGTVSFHEGFKSDGR